MVRRLGVVALVGLVALLVATAASACNPGRTDDNATYFTGAGTYSSGSHGSCNNGVQALVWTTNPYVLGGISSAWVGIDHTQDISHAVVGQTGWQNAVGTVSGHGTGTWAGIAELSGWDQYTNWTKVANDTYHVYQAFYNGGYFHFNVDGTHIYAWPYSGDGVTNSTCFHADVDGEVNTFANQMPGTLNDKQSFASIETRWGPNHVWDSGTDQNLSLLSHPAEYGESHDTVGGSPNVYEWDTCNP